MVKKPVEKKQNHEGLILLVDDEESIRESLGDLLDACGFKVFTADGVDKGIAVLTQNPGIETVLSDLKMPVKSGLEMLKHLNDHKISIPIIFLTGFGTLESCQQAVRGGAFDYILKPIEDKEKVLMPLKHAVEKCRLERKNEELRADILLMAEESQRMIDEILTQTEHKDLVHERIGKIIDKYQ